MSANSLSKKIPTDALLAEQKFAQIAIIGLPNAGKSTLVNALVGQKVSIVSPRVQTTRRQITGIALHNNAQLVLIDTPGIFPGTSQDDKHLVTQAWDSLFEADIIMLVIDVHGKMSGVVEVLNKIPATKPLTIVLNKTDKVSPQHLLETAKYFNDLRPDIEHIFMTSALNGKGVDTLADTLAEMAPVMEWPYPADQLSTLPSRFFAEEITREQIFNQLAQEIPYYVKIETEEWSNNERGHLIIRQLLYVERSTHKAVILGKGGHQIKNIGTKARLELEKILDTRVHLFLHVKVLDKEVVITPY